MLKKFSLGRAFLMIYKKLEFFAELFLQFLTFVQVWERNAGSVVGKLVTVRGGETSFHSEPGLVTGATEPTTSTGKKKCQKKVKILAETIDFGFIFTSINKLINYTGEGLRGETREGGAIPKIAEIF